MEEKKRKLEENGNSDISKEDAKKLIDILSPEQVSEILEDAALRHGEILEEIRKHADKDPVHRKIFVRGLGWDTTTDTMKSVFSQYGELEDGIVIKDKATGKSRGFGFITFKHMDGALRALKEPNKKIENRTTVCQLANSGPNNSSAPQPAEDLSSRKLYVSNLPPDLTADQFMAFFSQFGEIVDGPQGFDSATGRSRGFGLLVFKSAEQAKCALQEPVKYMNGQQIYCKLAVEGPNQKQGAPIVHLGPQEGRDSLRMGHVGDLNAQTGHPGAQIGHPGRLNQPFGQVNKSLMTGGLPVNQAIHGSINQGVHPGMQAPLSSTTQSLGIPAMNNPQNLNAVNYPGQGNLPMVRSQEFPQQIGNQGVLSQAPLRAGVAGYGNQAPGGVYGLQGSTYGSQAVENPNYFGTPASSVPLQGTSSAVVGSYITAGYPSAQHFGGSGASRSQTPMAPSNVPQYYHG